MKTLIIKLSDPLHTLLKLYCETTNTTMTALISELIADRCQLNEPKLSKTMPPGRGYITWPSA